MSTYRRRLTPSMAKLELDIEDHANAIVTGIIDQLSEDMYRCSVSFGSPYSNWRGYIDVPKFKFPPAIQQEWAKLQEQNSDEEPKMLSFTQTRPSGRARFGNRILRETRDDYVVALAVTVQGEEFYGEARIPENDKKWKEIVEEAKKNVAPECDG